MMPTFENTRPAHAGDGITPIDEIVHCTSQMQYFQMRRVIKEKAIRKRGRTLQIINIMIGTSLALLASWILHVMYLSPLMITTIMSLITATIPITIMARLLHRFSHKAIVDNDVNHDGNIEMYENRLRHLRNIVGG